MTRTETLEALVTLGRADLMVPGLVFTFTEVVDQLLQLGMPADILADGIVVRARKLGLAGAPPESRKTKVTKGQRSRKR